MAAAIIKDSLEEAESHLQKQGFQPLACSQGKWWVSGRGDVYAFSVPMQGRYLLGFFSEEEWIERNSRAVKTKA